jgi:hypothetical protein
MIAFVLLVPGICLLVGALDSWIDVQDRKNGIFYDNF